MNEVAKQGKKKTVCRAAMERNVLDVWYNVI